MTDSPARPVRVRFAPSPTGSLHIGGLRTALFNYLFARHHGGQFILRIEDTDQKRYDANAYATLTEALRWAGLQWDEGPEVGGPYGPYVQSQRADIYRQWAQWLVDHDKAYQCYCSLERLEQVNKEKVARKEAPGYDRRCRSLTPDERATFQTQGITPVIRFKMPLDGVTVVRDIIRGEVPFDNSTLQDLVLLKSDGLPTYHLANVVDDHLMGISHILRANEWLSTAPVHVQLYTAFGWDVPAIAHLPLLLNPNGKGKISKRKPPQDEHGHVIPVMVHDYIRAGYVPEAVVNFLTNIGWSFGDDREKFSLDEAIARFDLARVNAANSAYPIDKLKWLNGEYLRDMPAADLAARLRPFLEKAGYTVGEELLLRVVPLVQIRIKTLADIVDLAGFFFDAEFKPAPPHELVQDKLDIATTRSILSRAYETLAALDDFSHAAQEPVMRALAEQLSVKPKQMFGTLRVAVTGQRVATPLFETMEILGKNISLERIRLAAEGLVSPA